MSLGPYPTRPCHITEWVHLKKLNGRLGCFDCLVEPSVDNWAIHSSVSTFQTYFQNLWKQVTSGAIFQSVNPQQLRNLSRTQVVAGGVVLAECLGFFTVGEMIGRLKLIGYHGEVHHAHH